MRTVAPADAARFEMALSRAWLDQRASAWLEPSARLYRSRPTVALGRPDLRREGAAAAIEAVTRNGFAPVLRVVGGRVAAYDEGCLVYERLVSRGRGEDSTTARYAAMTEFLRDTFVELGIDARVGPIEGEWCPGAHSVNAGGRFKLAGVGQRVTSTGAITSAVIVVEAAAPLRRVLGEVHAALGLDLDPVSIGGVRDAAPEVEVEDLALLLAANSAAAGVPCEHPDDALLEVAKTNQDAYGCRL